LNPHDKRIASSKERLSFVLLRGIISFQKTDVTFSKAKQLFLLKVIPALPRLVKCIQKFKTGDENLNIEKTIAFDKHVTELFFVFYVHNN